ncbi:hypothetical protein SARC_03439 [Sphaeroforma arctica JP610]|uniref:Proteasome subunit beta n=1 Tax=Sphaeroforma arctica JP610 TaxID=667725 RepID=A0A0L0G5V4_9EUKA|nr:hypothetical protein SARC_03439 [Sphaeroforma arctica JP610]KNC84334.1 hypothetical protein SARC_03439 [Sphaeroforma arctica JP610]|eukprot:XP_014158236.1 hypothetical protein SARC_03439 [Sphaeroforma arctica JP610]
MDYLLGIVGDGFTVMVADKTAARSIMVLRQDFDKMVTLNKNTLMSLAGPIGDCTVFGEYIRANVQLFELRQGVPMTSHACANFTRNELAKALRSRNAYQCFSLIGGFDEETGQASLHWMDYLASMHKLQYGAHGYGAAFTLGLLDKRYKPNMTLDEVIEIVKACMLELKTRFIISLKDFTFRVVDKDGIRELTVEL